MKRGELVTAVSSGDYGKPRPALIVQADIHVDHPSVTVLPLTTTLHDAPLFRITVEPGDETDLRRRSQVMIDKATTLPRIKIGRRIGRLDEATMVRITAAMAAFLEIYSGEPTYTRIPRKSATC